MNEKRKIISMPYFIFIIISIFSICIFGYLLSNRYAMKVVNRAPIVTVDKTEDIVRVIEDMYEKNQQVVKMDISKIYDYSEYDQNDESGQDLVKVEDVPLPDIINMDALKYPAIRIKDGGDNYKKFVYLYNNGKLVRQQSVVFRIKNQNAYRPGDKDIKYDLSHSQPASANVIEGVKAYNGKYGVSWANFEWTSYKRVKSMRDGPFKRIAYVALMITFALFMIGRRIFNDKLFVNIISFIQGGFILYLFIFMQQHGFIFNV